MGNDSREAGGGDPSWCGRKTRDTGCILLTHPPPHPPPQPPVPPPPPSPPLRLDSNRTRRDTNLVISLWFSFTCFLRVAFSSCNSLCWDEVAEKRKRWQLMAPEMAGCSRHWCLVNSSATKWAWSIAQRYVLARSKGSTIVAAFITGVRTFRSSLKKHRTHEQTRSQASFEGATVDTNSWLKISI